ncbi:putative AAA-ATPase [Iris pallida]|uniref:AAA-ATPase n=1 Tax=Iris pallida TaxID=29817 RepID=A0AAX6EW30_IRIPA|nr:putative AAA-ATPase [Iris pallida]
MEMIWDWKSIGSLLATVIFLRSAVNDFVPHELRNFLRSLFARLYSSLRPSSTVIIDEFEPSGGDNELFEASQSYLSWRCLSSAPVLRLCKPRHSRTILSSLPSAHSATDYFNGAQFDWVFHSVDKPSAANNIFARSSSSEHRYFDLSFHRRYKEMVHSHYIPFILEEAARLKDKSRERKLYTNRSIASPGELWSSVPFHHPSTFDTLAIDPALSDSIRSDLLRFSARREYYARVGRAWKRGYLLHGPPGTGKTSLIAAIANFLEFDVYDLELTSVTSNSNLRKLLISTSSKSVIVVEDVDCSLDLSDRKKFKNLIHPGSNYGGVDECVSPASAASPFATVNLSGVLNFVDGLWSSCVGERLMIFTTNHPERLDPALLRPGRMDRKIELSYCQPAAFRILAQNYLQKEIVEGCQLEMTEEAEGLLKEVTMTPAEIAEIFMGCDGDAADVGLKKVVEELKRRSRKVVQQSSNGGELLERGGTEDAKVDLKGLVEGKPL